MPSHHSVQTLDLEERRGRTVSGAGDAPPASDDVIPCAVEFRHHSRGGVEMAV